MSFSKDIKKELTSLPATTGTLTALVRMNGSLSISSHLSLVIKTENSAIAQYIFKAFYELYEIRAELEVEQRQNLNKGRIYQVYVAEEVERLLDELSLADSLMLDSGIPDFIKDNELLHRDYLRGAFLAKGTIQGLEQSHYQMAIESTYQEHAEDLSDLLKRYGFQAKLSTRSESKYIVYLSRAEEIADFLTLIGAMKARLVFEDNKILREMRGLANRQSNFESANIRKSVSASQEIIAAIKHLSMLKKLPSNLIEIAKLRVENPDASLTELGQISDPPLSKSAVNHRLRKILALENDLKQEEVDDIAKQSEL